MPSPLQTLTVLELALTATAHTIMETIHGAVVFSRHGDRTSKHYTGYRLTNLGFQQNYQVGSSYRSRYLSADSPQQILGVSENAYVPSQIYASAPDQAVLSNTATAFLQGLYPPLDSTVSTQQLNNGSVYEAPLDGYQYVFLKGADANSPDTIWIKGDEGCPAVTNAADTFAQSSEYQTKLESTKDFYAGLWDFVDNVYDYTPQKMNYSNAYDIFDLINVASIHNTSFPRTLTSEEALQLRTLADSAEFGTNFNASQPDRSIGGRTLSGAILNQLNKTVSTEGKLKFSLLAGSYDTFLAFFGISNLTSVSTDFTGLPDYASTMAFELFTTSTDNTTATSFPTDVNDLNVRFLFKNGSTGGLNTYPLFGQSDLSMSWPTFVTEMEARAITKVEDWCSICSSTEDFCLPYGSAASQSSSSGGKGMSNTIAGVIGAMVTLCVIAILAAIAFALFRRRSKRSTEAVPIMVQAKSSIHSGDSA